MSDEQPVVPAQPGDLPIERLEQDALGWRKYIFALMRTLERAETPFVLGVYGGWGSGKTSFVNCLADAARTELWPKRGQAEAETPETEPHLYQWRVVHVNPWECDTAEDAKKLIATAVWREAFNGARWDTATGWRDGIRMWARKHSEALVRVLDAGGSVVGASELGRAVQALFSANASVAVRYRSYLAQDMAQALSAPAERPGRYLIVIDDLDRCRQGIIPEVLETIKLHLNQPGCVFVLAADPERVGRVLGRAYGAHDDSAEEIGNRYLDKIVQLPFWVPRMSDDAAAGFVDACACLLHPGAQISPEMRALLLEDILRRNPRAIRRFCLAHGLLAELGAIEGEADADKLAKVLAIRMCFPGMHRGYAHPRGAALLLEDQERVRGDDVSRTEATDEELVATHSDVVGQVEAERHVAGLRDPALKRLFAADPPFADAADVDRFFELAGGGAKGDDEVSDELAAALEMLGSESADERAQGARLLGEIGDTRAVEPLIRALADREFRVRSAAAWALGRVGDEGVVDRLIELSRTRDHNARQGAAWALGNGRLQTGIGKTRLLELLTDDDSRFVRGAAARSLANFQSEAEDAVEPLIRALAEDPAWQVRENAAFALGQIGDGRAVAPLIERLNDLGENEHVRANAAGALGVLHAEGAVEWLIPILQDRDQPSPVRQSAAWALGQIGDTRAVSALIGLLEDPHKSIRLEAVTALGLLRDTRAAAGLRELLRDPDADLRVLSARSLQMIGAAEVVPDIIGALRQEDSEAARMHLCSVLGDFEAHAALAAPLLRDVLARTSDGFTRSAAEEAIERIEAAVLDVMRSNDPDQRVEAARRLGEVGGARAVDALVAALDDDSIGVRRTAVNELGKLGAVAEKALPRLRKMRGEGSDEDLWLRAGIAVAQIEAAIRERDEKGGADAEE